MNAVAYRAGSEPPFRGLCLALRSREGIEKPALTAGFGWKSLRLREQLAGWLSACPGRDRLGEPACTNRLDHVFEAQSDGSRLGAVGRRQVRAMHPNRIVAGLTCTSRAASLIVMIVS